MKLTRDIALAFFVWAASSISGVGAWLAVNFENGSGEVVQVRIEEGVTRHQIQLRDRCIGEAEVSLAGRRGTHFRVTGTLVDPRSEEAAPVAVQIRSSFDETNLHVQTFLGLASDEMALNVRLSGVETLRVDIRGHYRHQPIRDELTLPGPVRIQRNGEELSFLFPDSGLFRSGILGHLQQVTRGSLRVIRIDESATAQCLRRQPNGGTLEEHNGRIARLARKPQA